MYNFFLQIQNKRMGVRSKLNNQLLRIGTKMGIDEATPITFKPRERERCSSLQTSTQVNAAEAMASASTHKSNTNAMRSKLLICILWLAS